MAKKKATTNVRFEEAELFWKKTEVALKETHASLQKLVFNLHSLEQLTHPRLSFHMVTAQLITEPYRRGIATTATLLEIVGEAVSKALALARESVPVVQTARVRDAKTRGADAFESYRLHTFLNAQLFQSMTYMSEAFEVLCREGLRVWGNAFLKDFKRIAKTERSLHDGIRDGLVRPYCGVALDELLERERRAPTQVPLAIERIHARLLETGLDSKGLFRHTSFATIAEIEELAGRMTVVDFSEYTPDVIAAVYKYFLGHLPERVLNGQTSLSLFSTWITCKNNPELLCSKIARTLASMPLSSQTLFANIIHLCAQVVLYRDVNLMNARNLAILLSPLLFTLPKPEMFQGLNMDNNTTRETEQAIDICFFIISNYTTLFPTSSIQIVKRQFQPSRSSSASRNSFSSDVVIELDKSHSATSTPRNQLPTTPFPFTTSALTLPIPPDLSISPPTQTPSSRSRRHETPPSPSANSSSTLNSNDGSTAPTTPTTAPLSVLTNAQQPTPSISTPTIPPTFSSRSTSEQPPATPPRRPSELSFATESTGMTKSMPRPPIDDPLFVLSPRRKRYLQTKDQQADV